METWERGMWRAASGGSGRTRAERQGGSDQGSMVLLVTVAVVLAGLAAVATAELGVAMMRRQCAQTAADAAALAGVEGGRTAAVRLAVANHGQLEAFGRDGWTVTVTARCGRATARATASNGP